MEARELVAALERRATAVDRACAGALLAGAHVTETEAGTRELLTIYRRRARHTEDHAVPTVGFRDAVTDLAETRHDRLRVIGVSADDPPYHFTVFVAPSESEIVACIGVDQANREM